MLEIPWNTRTDDAYDIAGARAILDADHAGLDDVKDRIIEYLAVRKRRADKGLTLVGGRRSGAVLALAGPPGVGKTSLGESVARAMGRKFARVALGGVRDEAEIRGHRRTYVGALPGRIVRAIREAGSMNPVILLDEVDKLGADYRGDPTAALLEVLDPAQNHTFRDHYLEVELDLSDVLFIATANVAGGHPRPAAGPDGADPAGRLHRGREGHHRPGPPAAAAAGAGRAGRRPTSTVTDDALRRLAGEYTREAGVRALERTIARVLRKIAAQAGRRTRRPCRSPWPRTTCTGYLGHPRHTPESAERTAVPGVATGLAVTGTGGDVLFIEASLADPETGSTGVTLTGQLGDVMKESAQIALSYLRSHGAELELPVGDLKDRGVHVHVPAGAVPKDGPSAGVTMTTALASLLSGRLVRSDVAMTGEVSLTGRVLPIGGVKQKLLAAHRAGITTVLIPKRNEPDLDDVPADVRDAADGACRERRPRGARPRPGAGHQRGRGHRGLRPRPRRDRPSLPLTGAGGGRSRCAGIGAARTDPAGYRVPVDTLGEDWPAWPGPGGHLRRYAGRRARGRVGRRPRGAPCGPRRRGTRRARRRRASLGRWRRTAAE